MGMTILLSLKSGFQTIAYKYGVTGGTKEMFSKSGNSIGRRTKGSSKQEVMLFQPGTNHSAKPTVQFSSPCVLQP